MAKQIVKRERDFNVTNCYGKQSLNKKTWPFNEAARFFYRDRDRLFRDHSFGRLVKVYVEGREGTKKHNSNNVFNSFNMGVEI